MSKVDLIIKEAISEAQFDQDMGLAEPAPEPQCILPFDQYYSYGLERTLEMQDTLASYFGPKDISYMNMDQTWSGRIELKSTEHSPIGTIKVISVAGEACAVADIFPKDGSGRRMLGVFYDAASPMYTPINKPGKYDVWLSNGGQLVVDWAEVDGKPADQIDVSYRSPETVQWPRSVPEPFVPEGEALVCNAEGGSFIKAGEEIPLPKGIAETEVIVDGEKWLIVSRDGEVAYEKEMIAHEDGTVTYEKNPGKPKIYFNGPKAEGERLSVKPRPDHPFTIEDGKVSVDQVAVLLRQEFKNGIDKQGVPSAFQGEAFPRLDNPPYDEFFDHSPSKKAYDLYGLDGKKKGGGPAFFKQDANEFAKAMSGRESSPSAEIDLGKTPALGLPSAEEINLSVDAENAIVDGVKGNAVLEAMNIDKLAFFEKGFHAIHGEGNTHLVNLIDSPPQMLELTSSAESPFGEAHVLYVEGEAFGISERTVNGKRMLYLYRSAHNNYARPLEEPGVERIKTRNGGILNIDWFEGKDHEGKPYGRVEVSYIKPEDVHAFNMKNIVEGEPFVESYDVIKNVADGERIPIPKEGLSRSYVTVGDAKWIIYGDDGKVLRLEMNGKVPEIVVSPGSATLESSIKPTDNHAFKVTPEGDVYFSSEALKNVKLKEGAAPTSMEKGAVPEARVAVESVKGPLQMGELFGSGAFNATGGAIVVMEVEGLKGFYEATTGKPMPKQMEAVAQSTMGLGSFYLLGAWSHSASTAGAMDWVAYNANFAQAMPAAAVMAHAAFTPSAEVVADLEAGGVIDPASPTGDLAVALGGGMTLAAMTGAELPAFATVNGFNTVGLYMSGEAAATFGFYESMGMAAGAAALNGAAVAGSWYVGYHVVGPMADDIGGRAMYSGYTCVGDSCFELVEETPYSDGTISGWLAEDWRRPAVAATVMMGPMGALYAYGIKEYGDLIAEKFDEKKENEPKADAFDHSEGPFTSIW